MPGQKRGMRTNGSQACPDQPTLRDEPGPVPAHQEIGVAKGLVDLGIESATQQARFEDLASLPRQPPSPWGFHRRQHGQLDVVAVPLEEQGGQGKAEKGDPHPGFENLAR